MAVELQKERDGEREGDRGGGTDEERTAKKQRTDDDEEPAAPPPPPRPAPKLWQSANPQFAVPYLRAYNLYNGIGLDIVEPKGTDAENEADTKELAAYIKRIRFKVHPDRNLGMPEAETASRFLDFVAGILLDVDLRMRYSNLLARVWFPPREIASYTRYHEELVSNGFMPVGSDPGIPPNPRSRRYIPHGGILNTDQAALMAYVTSKSSTYIPEWKYLSVLLQLPPQPSVLYLDSYTDHE